VAVEAEGYQPAASEEVVAAGEATTVVFHLRAKPRAAPPAAVQDIEVKGERPAREVTRRPLEQREITRIAGTNGDALRAVENMPGVARPPFIAGGLIIRGSAPADTDIYVDGTAIPIAYHFGGLSSVVPSELLSRIDFYPGNFGPEYGRALGGIVDIGLRSPRKDGIHGMAQMDLLDARLVLEAPLGPTTRFLVAARRSYVDAWITPILESSSTGVSTAPAYYDYQAMLEQDIGSSSALRLTLFGSDDRLALSLNSTGGDPSLAGDLSNRTRFIRAQLRSDTRLSETTRWINMVSWGIDHTQFTVGSVDVDILTRPLQLRSDLRLQLARGIAIVAGADLVRATADVSVYAPPIPEDGQNNGPGFARPRRLQTLRDILLYRLGGYAMLELEPARGLKLLPSIRIDNSDEIGDTRVAPRLAVRWELGEELRTTLKAGAGLYFQPPQPYEAFRPFGTPELRHSQAQHYSAGIEQQLRRRVDLSIEGFYKKLDHLVDQRPDATGSESGVTYVNSGSRRVYGMELLLRYRADARFFGWVAYTLSRSERRADDSEDFRRFDFDQTHILTAVGSVKPGHGWELGGRFRYVTGSPFTPPMQAIYDADAGAYSPINGTPFSARSAPFHQLDLRVDKTWDLRASKLGVYLDVQNVYSRRNPEGRQYNFDYSQSDRAPHHPGLRHPR